jgi:hypothetical protein
MKKCRGKCGKEYPATPEYFYKNGKYLRTNCKQCQSEIQQEYAGRYPETQKKWREANRDKTKETSRLWYQQNRERARERNGEYYRANAEAVCERTKKYRQDNPEWYRKYRRDWRRRNRLISNVRAGIWGCLSGRQKDSSSVEYIGCTLEELWVHLESKFQDGMTRKNYGEWHVDHIRPLSSFDFEVDTENTLHEAWHYTNLQPLWAKDNLSKGSSWKNKG